MIRVVKKVLHTLGWLVLTVVLLVTSFTFWGSEKGWQFDAVLSGSMVPIFPVGGLVVVRPVDVNTLQVGDVISFKYPNMNTPVCHRIHAIEYINGVKYFETKGDANNAPEQFLTPLDAVYGRAIFHVPYVGWVIEAKNLGTVRVSVFGRGLPVAGLLVLGMGMLFVGLILRDTLDDIFHPAKRWKRDMLKKRKERLLMRKKAFRIT